METLDQTQHQVAVDPVMAYIGLGSNLADPEIQLKHAVTALNQLTGVSVVAVSSFYRSKPMGPQNQPDYVNAVSAVRVELSPTTLLRALQQIELDQGRVRTGERWGSRTLDLDLLLYGELIISEPDLTVPHPGVVERAFVLYPLYEIAPSLIVPGKGPIGEWLARCPSDGLIRID